MTPVPYSVFCLTDRKAIVPLPWVPNRLLMCKSRMTCASVPGFLPEHLLSVRKAGVPLTRSCRCLPSAGLQGTVYTADPALSPLPNASAIWSRRSPLNKRPTPGAKELAPPCRPFSLHLLQAFPPPPSKGPKFFLKTCFKQLTKRAERIILLLNI